MDTIEETNNDVALRHPLLRSEQPEKVDSDPRKNPETQNPNQTRALKKPMGPFHWHKVAAISGKYP